MHKIKQILDKYKLDKRINYNQVDYYYTNDTINCCKYSEKPMFDIKEFDYLEPIKRLINYYEDDYIKKYYEQLYDRLNTYKPTGFLDSSLIKREHLEDIDEMMIDYLKCRPKTFILTLWPLVNKTEDLISFLKKNGNVYYYKEIQLSYNACFNLVYQLYGDATRLKTLKDIKEKLDYIGWGKESNTVRIIVFDNINNLPISGGKAPFKEQIRQLAGKNHTGKRGDDFVHVNDNYYQTIEYAQIYFHKNSLKFLHKQDLARHLSFKKSRLYLQTFKNWFIKNIDLIDRDRFIIFGGTVLYTHGIRENRDIDGLVVPYTDKTKTSNFKEKIIKDLYQKNTRFFFLDFGMENSEAWKESWTEKNKQWYDLMNIKRVEQMTYDREYYYYFQGMKFLCLKYELLRRILRKKITDYADLIATSLVVKNGTLNLPPVDQQNIDEILKYFKEKYPDLYDEKNIRKILSKK